jgi:hypothetical protein
MNGFVRVGLILLMVSLSAVAEVPGFKLAKKYPVSGFFDYIVFDASSNRLGA